MKTISQFLPKTFYLLVFALLFAFYACEKMNNERLENAVSANKNERHHQLNAHINPFLDELQTFDKKPISFISDDEFPPIWHLNREELVYTYLGLSIKGSGGGGGFVDGKDILNRIKSLDIYDISMVEDDKLYIVAGGIGAPTAIKKELDNLIESIKSSVLTLANSEGKKIGGILSVESGSANSTIAMLLSKSLSVPLIDADGAGRSVPKLSNLSYAHESYSIAPTVLTSVANPGVTIEVLNPKDADDAEKLIRATISKPGFGQIAGLALWAQSGAELKKSSVIKNTFRQAYKLGHFVKEATQGNIDQLDSYFKNSHQFIKSYQGTLSDFQVKTQGGFDITTLKIASSDGQTLTIKALNENLLLSSSDGTVVTAPHLISYMVEVSDNHYLPINNGDAKLMESLIGKKIHVVTAFSNHRLYDYSDTFLKILKTVFGYSGGVVPPFNVYN